jgi:hypothetical protein
MLNGFGATRNDPHVIFVAGPQITPRTGTLSPPDEQTESKRAKTPHIATILPKWFLNPTHFE